MNAAVERGPNGMNASISERERPRPWVLIALFAIALCWSLGYEHPLTTPACLLAIGIILAHVARVVAEDRPSFVEIVVMLVGNGLILSAPQMWLVFLADHPAMKLRAAFSLPALMLFGAPLLAANLAWLLLFVGGTWASFGRSGWRATTTLAAVSLASGAAVFLYEYGKAIGRA
jgi:hypothetical protein